MIYQAPNIVAVVLFTVVFSLYTFGVGRLIVHRALGTAVGNAENQAEFLFLSLTTGFLAEMAVASLLAAFGLFAALPLALTGAGVALTLWWSRRRGLSAPPIPPALGIATAIIVAIAMVISLHSPGAAWDDTMYHLPVARDLVEARALTVDATIRYPLFPQGGEVMTALGLLFAGEVGAQFVATFPVVFTVLGLIALGGLFTRRWTVALVAIAIVMAVPEDHSLLGLTQVDLILGAFGLAALGLITNYERRRDERLLWLAGAMVGGACSVKYVGLPFALITGLYLVVTIRRVKPIVQFVACALLIGGGWYLRAWLVSGDPFHPFGGNLFGHYLWNAQDLLDQTVEQRNSVQGSPLPGPLKMVWRKWGLVSLIFLAFVPFVLKREPQLRAIVAISCSILVLWLLLSKEARYLAPVIGGIGIIAGAGTACLLPKVLIAPRAHAERWAPWALAGMAALLLGLTSIRMIGDVRGWTSAQSSMKGLRAYALANDQASQHGGRILQLGFENGIDFARHGALGDWFGPWRYRQFVTCETLGANVSGPCALIAARKMRAAMVRINASVLIVNLALFQFDAADYAHLFEVHRTAPDQAVLIPAPHLSTHWRNNDAC